MARDVVLSGPRCNKFVSRLFKCLVFCIDSSNFAVKHLLNIRLENIPNFSDLVYVRARWQVARRVATIATYQSSSPRVSH